MKITDTLEHLLRLLVTTDEEGVNDEQRPMENPEQHADETADRPLPDWVRRVNERTQPAQRESEAPELVAEPVAPTATHIDEPEPPEGDRLVPGVLESLISWVQTQEPKPAAVPVEEGEPPAVAPVDVVAAREPEPQPVVIEPEPEPVGVEPDPIVVEPFGIEPVDAAPVVVEPLGVEPVLVEDASHTEPEPEEHPVFSADLQEAEAGLDVVPYQRDLSHLATAAYVVESLNLGFHLGSAVQRIAAAATQGSEGVPALREAAWLIERYIAILEKRPIGADLHLAAARLARSGDAISGLKALADALDADAHGDGEVPSETDAEAPVNTLADGVPAESSGHDIWGTGRIRQLSQDPPPA